MKLQRSVWPMRGRIDLQWEKFYGTWSMSCSFMKLGCMPKQVKNTARALVSMI